MASCCWSVFNWQAKAARKKKIDLLFCEQEDLKWTENGRVEFSSFAMPQIKLILRLPVMIDLAEHVVDIPEKINSWTWPKFYTGNITLTRRIMSHVYVLVY